MSHLESKRVELVRSLLNNNHEEIIEALAYLEANDSRLTQEDFGEIDKSISVDAMLFILYTMPKYFFSVYKQWRMQNGYKI